MGALTALSLMLLVRGLSMDLRDIEGSGTVTQASAGATPVIALTALDVNDQTLKLRYKIMNRSDHDIWVCEGVGIAGKPDLGDSEVYVDKDARSLVIAKWIEAPMELMYVRPPDLEGRYVRLRPGQERMQSLLLAIPVKRHTLFTSSGRDVDYATRLLLRIGSYDKDLAGGKDAEEVVVPYRLAAYISGDERYLEVVIDGVFINIVSRIAGIRPPAGIIP